MPLSSSWRRGSRSCSQHHFTISHNQSIRHRAISLLTHTVATGDAMELLRSNLSRVRIPKPTCRIYKQECCISFDNPKSEGGLYVDMNFYLAFGKDFVMWNFKKTGNPVYLHIKQTKKMVPEDRHLKKPSLLATGMEDGFRENESEYEETHSIVILPNFETLAFPSVELPEKVRLAVDAILMAEGNERKEDVVAEVADNKRVSAYAMNLLQIDNGIVVPSFGWECAKCDETKNLWLNLTDGMILCGTRNLNGSGGKDHAVEHYNESGYPLAVKLGTITSDLDSADVYSYVEGTSVLDPSLAQHLAFFGIDWSSTRKVRDDDLEYEYRLKTWCAAFDPRPRPILHTLAKLFRLAHFESAIRAAVQFWDKEDHLFRFGDQELVLLPSEFDAFLELGHEDPPVMPAGEVCTRQSIIEFLDIDCQTAARFCLPTGVLSLRDLLDLFSSTESFPLQTRRRAATMCILGYYLFRRQDLSAPYDLADIVSQLEEGRSLGSLIVAEIIESLDRWATPETCHSFFSGSIVLLQIWLFDHLKVQKDDYSMGRLIPATVFLRKMPTIPEQGWHTFFSEIQTGEQIRWVMPWWNARGDLVQSGGYSGVILAGLQNYYTIYPLRGMRQFGERQAIPTYDEPDFSKPVYDRSVVREIFKAWKNGIRWGIRQLQSNDCVELSEECQRWVRLRHMRIIKHPYDPWGVKPCRIDSDDAFVNLTPVEKKKIKTKMRKRKKKKKKMEEMSSSKI